MSYDQLYSNSTKVAAFKKHVIILISSSTGVNASLVNIKHMYAGSVVLEIEVTSPANPQLILRGGGGADPIALAQIDTALSSMTNSSASTFNSTFQAQYGITSVAAISLAISMSPPPSTVGIASAASSSLTIFIAAAAGGGVCVVGSILVAIVIYMVRRGRKLGKIAPDIVQPPFVNTGNGMEAVATASPFPTVVGLTTEPAPGIHVNSGSIDANIAAEMRDSKALDAIPSLLTNVAVAPTQSAATKPCPVPQCV